MNALNSLFIWSEFVFRELENKEKEGSFVKRFGIGAAIAGGVAAAIIGLAAPAAAAPSGSDNAVQTIGQLRSQGYTVIVNRLGNTPLDQAEVVAVRPGQSYTHIDAGQPVFGSQRNYSTVQDKIVYVDVK
jgi:hypothetical protein